jgi:hypothetical protein
LDEHANNINLEDNDSSEITTKVNTVEDKLVDYDDDKTLEEVDLSEKETSADKYVTETFEETKTEVSDKQSTDSFDNSKQATENEDTFEEIKDDPQKTNDLQAIDLVNQDSSEDNNNIILLTNDIKSEDFKIDDSNQDLTLDGPMIGSKSITSVYICSFLKFHLYLTFYCIYQLDFVLLVK